GGLVRPTIDVPFGIVFLHNDQAIAAEISMPFWVIGGEYTDTRFVDIVGGGAETRLGPFANYGDAKAEWARCAWSSVDDAHPRWRIEEEGEQECAYWVVGGEYTDTGFTTPAGG